MIGQINVPVKLTASITGEWTQTAGPQVNLRIALDKKSASFTPSENGTYKFECGGQKFEVVVGGTPTPTPIPPTPTPTGILYDSNVDIDWASLGGKVLKVTDRFGKQSPNGKGFHMNASGSPRMYLDPATKELTLEHDGAYGRAYFCVCNYQSRLECEFKLDSCSNNASFKTRNRHQYAEETGTSPPDTQKQGGQGTAFHCDSVDADLEIVHGGNPQELGGPSSSLSPKLVPNQWYKMKFSQFDKNGKIHVVDELDGKVVNEGDLAAPSQFFNKAEFEGWSEFWVRLNADSGGRLTIKNLKMFAL